MAIRSYLFRSPRALIKFLDVLRAYQELFAWYAIVYRVIGCYQVVANVLGICHLVKAFPSLLYVELYCM